MDLIDTISDKQIDQVRDGLLGLSNALSDSNAALLRQAEAMLRYFKLVRQRDRVAGGNQELTAKTNQP